MYIDKVSAIGGSVGLQLLASLEAKVQRHNLSFVEAGEALLEIRQHRFAEMEGGAPGRFREVTGYDGFREYCSAKWDISHQRSSQLINAARVYRNLEGGQQPVDPSFLPRTEGVIRPLTRLRLRADKKEQDAEAQREVWSTVYAVCEGKPSAEDVQRAVEMQKVGKLDEFTANSLAEEIKQIKVREMEVDIEDLPSSHDNYEDEELRSSPLLKASPPLLKEPTDCDCVPNEYGHHEGDCASVMQILSSDPRQYVAYMVPDDPSAILIQADGYYFRARI